MIESGPRRVIVDLAAEQAAIAISGPGEVVEHLRFTIIGYTDLPSRVLDDAVEPVSIRHLQRPC